MERYRKKERRRRGFYCLIPVLVIDSENLNLNFINYFYGIFCRLKCLNTKPTKAKSLDYSSINRCLMNLQLNNTLKTIR